MKFSILDSQFSMSLRFTVFYDDQADNLCKLKTENIWQTENRKPKTASARRCDV